MKEGWRIISIRVWESFLGRGNFIIKVFYFGDLKEDSVWSIESEEK